VAVSDSPASRRACETAAELASTFDVRLTMLHVVPPLRYRVGRLAPTVPVVERLDDPLRNRVLSQARQLAWTHGANPSTLLVAGEAEHVIVSIATDLEADLLLIGTTPRVLSRSLAGRRRRWIEAHAPCPVLPVAAARPRPPRHGLVAILAR
jgi:nucleotide-binding universal stress UspA family protein